MNVDHIKPLRRYWELRLASRNLQVLCGGCNHGKGNRDEADWRPRRSVANKHANARLDFTLSA
ncbi:MAG: HNH endonuclease [Alphaproteobacteria bacterium]|nr:HNH endonuclease [Alphaproteobacteria bacterium]